MAILKFEANIPRTLAFTYASGLEQEDKGYGVQFLRKTAAGDIVYLTPYLETKLIEMGIRANQSVAICKRMKGKKVEWEVSHTDEAAERPLAGQPKPNGAPVPAANGRVPHFMSEVLINCAKAAIDTALEANAYAGKLGYPLAFKEEDIRAWTATLYIQHAKQSNISTMHRHEEIRDTVRREVAKPRQAPPEEPRGGDGTLVPADDETLYDGPWNDAPPLRQGANRP